MPGATRYQGSNFRSSSQSQDPLLYLDNDDYMDQTKKRKKKPQEMPSKWKVYNNPDKTGHTKPPDYNLCQPGHPSRIIVVGKPGCGERSVMYNILENYRMLEE